MKKMGKKFIAGSAMVVTAVSSVGLLSGCFPFAPTPNVYGPPPDVPTEVTTDVPTDVTETIPETTLETDPSSFDPTSEILEGVYGPPVDYTDNTVEFFDPESEINVDVYGPPPEDFTPEEEINEDVYGPPVGE